MTADNEGGDNDPQNDAEFVKQFVAKMEKEEKAGGTKPPAAAPAARKDEPDEEIEEEIEEDIDPDADPDADPDDDEVDGDRNGADPDDHAEEGKGKKKDDDDDDEADTEFDRAAKSAKLPTRLDDLPEAARPVVEKRLKDMEAGFNRAQQKATEFRSEQREFRAEEAYRAAHPAEWLAALIAKDPALEEKIAAELEKLQGDPANVEAASALEKQRRNEAAEEIAKADKAEREQSEWLVTRSSEVETLAKTACRKSGISFDRGVEAAIAYEIRDQGDIDNDRIKEIVTEMAVERGRSQRALVREEKKRVIQGKGEARRNASPIRPGTGRAGGTTRTDTKPKSLEENMMATTEKLFPGEP